MSYAIGYCHPGTVDGGFCNSLVNLVRERPPDQVIAVHSGPRIAHARNEIVRAFLKSTTTWLLMVDTDMVFRPECLDTLLAVAEPAKRPFVGGLCFGGGRSGVMFPTIYRLQGGGTEPFAPVEDYPSDTVCEVDATGAAFLLMHRVALRRIGLHFEEPYPWFVEGTVYKGHAFGEDWAFCLRARQLGIPIHVHTGCEVGHVKSQILDSTAYRRFKELRDELGGDHGVVQDFARHSVGAAVGG